MSNIIQVNDDTFEQEVLNSDIPVLVDFGASWCGPCAKQEPILEKFAAENANIKIVKIDIEEAFKTTKTYAIHSVPTLIVFKSGKQVNIKSGLSTLKQIQDLIA